MTTNAASSTKLKITYCGAWGYKKRAVSLADELKSQFGYESELIKSEGGVFEIELNGKLLFSKASLGRFPEDGEVKKLVTEEVS